MQTQIILISGKQGSGKSTLQDAIHRLWTQGELNGFHARTFNFADVLYEMHHAVRDVGKEYGLAPQEPKDGVLLQLLGTEWGRNVYGANVWVDVLKKRLNDNSYWAARHNETSRDKITHMLYLVGDTRFENEFDGFASGDHVQVLKVRLRCPEHVRKQRCSKWRDNTNHASEIGLDRYDEEQRFDMYLDTEFTPIETCARLVIERVLGYDFPAMPEVAPIRLP